MIEMRVRKAIIRKGGNAWQITFLGEGLWFEKTARSSWGDAMDHVAKRMKI